MPEDSKQDAVEELIADEQAIETRKKALIADLLNQKEAAIKDYDDKLAKLGHQANSGKLKRSHHKRAASGDLPAKTDSKPRS